MAKRRGDVTGQLNFGFVGSAVKRAMAKAKKVKKTRAKKARRKKASSRKARSKQVKRKRKARRKTSAPKTNTKTISKQRITVAATAESMAAKQRAISISEFFAKNRHLLGFDNPRKALLTAVKEAVDNSLDACEEARILPDLLVSIKPVADNKFVLTVRDNGPGIVKQQIPNIFARLLYGSKFHSLKMSRGQQGIGISAAGMYGLLTTGEPVQIISRTNPKKNAHHYHVQIDTAKNRPEVVLDEECDFELPTGTSVTITLEGKYQRGRQSVDEYIAQSAMANPHAAILYNSPDDRVYEYPRQIKELPFAPREIKPHPYGVELGLLFKMARDSSFKQLSAFLQNEFSRVSLRVANRVCEKAKLRKTLRPSRITLKQAEALHAAVNETKIMAPSTDCIGPIGADQLEQGLRAVVDADFYTACSRSPAVYRGNPFLIEAALAYGMKGGGDGDPEKEPLMRLTRVANRVPLLYQQSGCAIYRAVMDINWRNYALSQSRGALPTGSVVLMVHIASVWVPFTSESKEAIAHYPEIIREIQLAVQDCGRKLGIYLRRKKRIQQELDKRRYIETYLPYIGEALQDILSLRQRQVNTVVARLKRVLEKSRKV
ncbi:MAG: DNA topoisomerase VI subunit B [Planctomycetota bacterium]|jgi:DNA topoisomerase-6 subunit B